jgi:DNA helicase HerA-like ATPase
VARSFRSNDQLDFETVLTELGIGEALVSTLDAKGRPLPVQKTLIRPPESRIGPLSDVERKKRLNKSPFRGHYDTVVDRESAYELLKKRAAEMRREAEKQAQQTPAKPTRGRRSQSIGDAFMKSTARSIGSYVGRQIIRGVLGSIFGGKR